MSPLVVKKKLETPFQLDTCTCINFKRKKFNLKNFNYTSLKIVIKQIKINTLTCLKYLR